MTLDPLNALQAVVGNSNIGTPPAAMDRSLVFNAAESNFLSLAPAQFGSYDRAKFAVSTWFKRAGTSDEELIGHHESAGSSDSWRLRFRDSALEFSSNKSLVDLEDGYFKTTMTFAADAWHHLLFHYDSANGTASERLKLWIDGAEISSFTSTPTWPTGPVLASSGDFKIGSASGGEFDGKLFQPAFFAGSLPTIEQVYADGSPLGSARSLVLLDGLYSLLDGNQGIAETDYVLRQQSPPVSWLSNGAGSPQVITSSDIPT
jgi:hypothetical protein